MSEEIQQKKLWEDWNEIFCEECRTDLRKTTVDLTDRLSHLLEMMFKPDHSVGWESWLLYLCEELNCRQALGIPAYYNQQQVSSILTGNLPGLSRTQNVALQMRIKIAFNLLSKVISHPLCPDAIKRFEDEFKLVRGSMKRAGINQDKEQYPIANSILDFSAGKPGETLRKMLLADKQFSHEERGNLRQELRKYRQSRLDSEYYSLLLTLDDVRAEFSGVDKIERETHLLRCCLRLAAYEDCFESSVMLWWCIAELFFVDKFYVSEDKDKDEEIGLKNIIEQTLRRNISSVSLYEEIEEYSEIKALPLMQISVAAMSVFQRNIANEIKKTREAQSDGEEYPFNICGNNRENITASAKEWIEKVFKLGDAGKSRSLISDFDDHGLLAVISTRLYCLLEFWRWQTFHEAIGCLNGWERKHATETYKKLIETQDLEGDWVRFGCTANKPRNNMYFTWPIWRQICTLPRIGGKDEPSKLLSQTWNNNDKNGPDKMPGTQYSFMILGSPGIGKGAIVDELWYGEKSKKDENRVFCFNRTPYEIDNRWLEDYGPEKRERYDDKNMSRTYLDFYGGIGAPGKRNGKTWTYLGESSYYLVFIDEIHLPSVVSPYGLMLKPLQEGHHKLQLNGKERAVYIFASSAYRSRDHFINIANEKKDAAMRDFSTRIKESQWVALPDLFTVPEHKYLVANKLLEFTRIRNTNEKGKSDISAKFARQLAIGWMMNFSIDSIRKIQQEVDKGEEKLIQIKLRDVLEGENSLWPKWVSDLIETML